MVINITNGEIINTKDISLHDDILEELSFDRKNKKLHLILFRECDNRKISMFFLNVVAFEMTACDFGENLLTFLILNILLQMSVLLFQSYLKEKKSLMTLRAHWGIQKCILKQK